MNGSDKLEQMNIFDFVEYEQINDEMLKQFVMDNYSYLNPEFDYSRGHLNIWFKNKKLFKSEYDHIVLSILYNHLGKQKNNISYGYFCASKDGGSGTSSWVESFEELKIKMNFIINRFEEKNERYKKHERKE